MAGTALTQYGQKKMLDHLLGITAFTMPSVYFGLSTTSPGETGSLTGEPSSGGYARQALTAKMGAAVFATGIATLATMLPFPPPTTAWGLMTHGLIADASTAGNVLAYQELDVPLSMVAGAPPAIFLPGLSLSAITFRIIDGSLTNLARQLVTDHLLGKTLFPMPTPVNLALLTASPTASGSVANECSGGSYARVEITSKMAPTVLETGIAINSSAVTFPSPTGSWETVSYIAGMAGVSMLWFAPIRNAFLVSSGDPAPSFPIGSLACGMK